MAECLHCNVGVCSDVFEVPTVQLASALRRWSEQIWLCIATYQVHSSS